MLLFDYFKWFTYFSVFLYQSFLELESKLVDSWAEMYSIINDLEKTKRCICVLEPLVSDLWSVWSRVLAKSSQSIWKTSKFSGWEQIPGSKNNEVWFNRDGGKQKKIWDRESETFDGFNQDGTKIRRLEVENKKIRGRKFQINYWNVLILLYEDESLPYDEAKSVREWENVIYKQINALLNNASWNYVLKLKEVRLL